MTITPYISHGIERSPKMGDKARIIDFLQWDNRPISHLIIKNPYGILSAKTPYTKTVTLWFVCYKDPSESDSWGVWFREDQFTIIGE